MAIGVRAAWNSREFATNTDIFWFVAEMDGGQSAMARLGGLRDICADQKRKVFDCWAAGLTSIDSNQGLALMRSSTLYSVPFKVRRQLTVPTQKESIWG